MAQLRTPQDSWRATALPRVGLGPKAGVYDTVAIQGIRDGSVGHNRGP